MSLEHKILKLYSSNPLFYDYVDNMDDFWSSSHTRDFFQMLKEYYDTNPSSTSVNAEDALSYNKIKYPGISKEIRELHQHIAESVDALNIDDIEEEYKAIVNAVMVRKYADSIMEKADLVSSGKKADLDDIKELLDEYILTCEGSLAEDDGLVTETAKSLLTDSIRKDGLPWRLECLNKALGPLSIGDLIIISARPDSGKTSMLASEASFMSNHLQDGKKILWFCNEERGEKIKKRVLTAHTGFSIKDMLAMSSTLLDPMLTTVDDLYRIYHVPGMDTNYIEKILSGEEEAGLIIIDQLRKVGSRWDRETSEHLRLQKLFEWARLLSQKYAPTMVVHQAGASGEGVIYMNMSDLHGSKTDIQGEADAIIMIGRDHDMPPNVRGISIPKNKLEGVESAFRNFQGMVNLNVDTGRFKD